MTTEADLTRLRTAVLQTIAYGDVFDYPMTVTEIHRYLIGHKASLPAVEQLLTSDPWQNGRLASKDKGYLMLPGREAIVVKRQQRARHARQLWPEAIRYGRLIARLPFVRMIAVTGSLAVDNPAREADIDYLIVTENGRLWVCRAFIIAIVRLAARRQLTLCPNYILSQSQIEFKEHNLYTAHEVAQMIPVAGQTTYQQLRQANKKWLMSYLPNAAGPPRTLIHEPESLAAGRRWLENSLRSRPGQWVEQWEMQRKIRKFRRQHQDRPTDTMFNADCCKGHFTAHNDRILTAFQTRLESYQLAGNKHG